MRFIRYDAPVCLVEPGLGSFHEDSRQKTDELWLNTHFVCLLLCFTALLVNILSLSIYL
jgi:hypothetical protein